MAKKQVKEKGPLSAPSTGGLQLPEGASVVRRVTLPSLAIKKVGQVETLTILDEMRQSKITQKTKRSDGKMMEPATICSAGKHPTGEVVTFIVPAIVKSNLLRDYAKVKTDDEGNVVEILEHNYVNKTFIIKNCGKRSESQRYNDFEITEIELPK